MYLALFRGMFWRADVRLAAGAMPGEEGRNWPGVAVIVPARNEAETLGDTLPGLLSQSYRGELSVYLVDDQSEDGTAVVARGLAEKNGGGVELRVIEGEALPRGWVGKVWAMQQGYAAAIRGSCEYLLFTDADILHPSGSVRDLAAKAEGDGLDMVSVMAKLRACTLIESLLIPAFVFFFGKLFPFRWVNDGARSTAAAAGGCMFVRRAALERVGGLVCIRDRIIDDCALASVLKGGESRGIWLGFSESVRSVRGYEGGWGVWGMVTRSAYAQLGNSPLLLAGAVGGMALTYVAPALGAAAGVAGLAMGAEAGLGAFALVSGALSWLLMAVVFLPMLLFYRKPAALSVLLPFIAAVYTLMTVDSARRYYGGSGGAWKGRTY